MVKKNPFTTSSQEKSTLQETDVSTIKRRLHQRLHHKIDRPYQKPSKTAGALLEEHSLDAEVKINLLQNDWKKKVWRTADDQSTQHHLWIKSLSKQQKMQTNGRFLISLVPVTNF